MKHVKIEKKDSPVPNQEEDLPVDYIKFIGRKVIAKNNKRYNIPIEHGLDFSKPLIISKYIRKEIGHPYIGINAARFFQFEGQKESHWFVGFHFKPYNFKPYKK